MTRLPLPWEISDVRLLGVCLYIHCRQRLKSTFLLDYREERGVCGGGDGGWHILVKVLYFLWKGHKIETNHTYFDLLNLVALKAHGIGCPLAFLAALASIPYMV